MAVAPMRRISGVHYASHRFRLHARRPDDARGLRGEPDSATVTVISREAVSAEPGSSSPSALVETPSSAGLKVGSLVGKYATFTAKEGRSRDDGFGKTEWAP